MYLQREAPTTLDVKAGRIILRVKEILPSGVLLLEGKDGQECRDNTKNCAPCHLPIEGTILPELVVVPAGYKSVVCGEKKGATTMLLYNQYQRGWHMACLTPPLSRPSHNLSGNGRAATSRDTGMTNRDLGASRGSDKRLRAGRAWRSHLSHEVTCKLTWSCESRRRTGTLES